MENQNNKTLKKINPVKIYSPMKRKMIQIASFGFTNARLGNFAKGEIYTGKWKYFCQPGLNCYSCPAAQFACPIGALQAVNGDPNHHVSFYVLGFILAFGVVFGRAICGFFCPFGLLQELIYKIPFLRYFALRRIQKNLNEEQLKNQEPQTTTSSQKAPKLDRIKLPVWATYIKYLVLLQFVILMPNVFANVMGMGAPVFCEFICPAGTLEGGIPLNSTHEELRASLGALFTLKMAILIAVLIGCMSVYRFFCKVLCPLGALYGILNKISFYGMTVDQERCINCGLCSKVCLMDVDPVKSSNSAECIRCGACAKACPKQAICVGFKAGQKEHVLKNE